MNRIKKAVLSFLPVLLFGMFLKPVYPAAPASPATQPAAANRPTVKMIWDYKTEVGLSDAQVAAIKSAINEFKRKILELRSKMQSNEAKIQGLIQKKSSLTAIKEKLNTTAALQVELRMADIETARKIDGLLMPRQAAKWQEIQKQNQAKR